MLQKYPYKYVQKTPRPSPSIPNIDQQPSVNLTKPCSHNALFTDDPGYKQQSPRPPLYELAPYTRHTFLRFACVRSQSESTRVSCSEVVHRVFRTRTCSTGTGSRHCAGICCSSIGALCTSFFFFCCRLVLMRWLDERDW